MSRQLDRLLRVRRLMEEMSRAEFAHRRMEQVELEQKRDGARETALALRGEARTALATGEQRPGEQGPGEQGVAGTPGLWHRYLDDSEKSMGEAETWERAARQAEARAVEAERQFLEERRSRMQAEILVRERAAAERVERERREQKEIDEWFGMGRGAGRRAAARRARSEISPI